MLPQSTPTAITAVPAQGRKSFALALTPGTLSLGAYLLLSAAILRSGGARDVSALALVLAALALALSGVGARLQDTTGRSYSLWLPRLLGALTAVELLWLGLRPESAFLSRQHVHLVPLLAALVIGVLSLSYAWGSFPWPRLRIPAILTVFLLLGAWLIHHAPVPAIDIWHFQQHAAELLVQGDNPYAGEYPNPYGHTRFLGEQLLKDGKVQSFPYPPLSLALVLPGYLLGDVRWSLLFAMAGTAGFLVATGRRLGLRPGHPAELAAVALLCNPWCVAMVELGWTEPLLALAISMTGWAIASGRQWLTVLGLAGVLALKQYGFLLLPAFAASGRLRWGQAITAGLLAAATALPFLLWDPGALQRGLVDFHVHNPFREDSLSVLAVVAVTTGCQLPGWIGLLAAGGVAAYMWRRGTPALSTTALGGAAILLAFFLFNRGAHLNYFWPILTLLALAVIVTTAEEGRQGETGESGTVKGRVAVEPREPCHARR